MKKHATFGLTTPLGFLATTAVTAATAARKMKNYATFGLITSLGCLSTVASAATGNSDQNIEKGFADVAGDLESLLEGSGGFLALVISVGFAVVMLAIGRGWGQAVVAFSVALILSYGLTSLKSIAGISGSTDMLIQSYTPSSQDPIISGSTDMLIQSYTPSLQKTIL